MAASMRDESELWIERKRIDKLSAMTGARTEVLTTPQRSSGPRSNLRPTPQVVEAGVGLERSGG